MAAEAGRVVETHNGDGTSWLAALLATTAAVAIAGRLRKTAKALPKIDPETGERDRRTRDQMQADLVAHWLPSCTGTAIDAVDLRGLTAGPGITRDGEHPVPAEWVSELGRERDHAVPATRARPAGTGDGHDETGIPAAGRAAGGVALARRHLPGRGLSSSANSTSTPDRHYASSANVSAIQSAMMPAT